MLLTTLLAGVATLPDVYLAFESTPDKDNKIQYDRGHDGVGTAAALISTNAFVEEKRGRHGKVLALRGVAPIAKIGANFQGTAVKYVKCVCFLVYDLLIKFS